MSVSHFQSCSQTVVHLSAWGRQTFVKVVSVDDYRALASSSFEVAVFVPCGGWDRSVSKMITNIKEH